MLGPAQMFSVISDFQTTTIFQGRLKPRIAAVELIALLCLITIRRLFSRGLETSGTTKSQGLTATVYICRKKVCNSFSVATEQKNSILCAQLGTEEIDCGVWWTCCHPELFSWLSHL